MVTCVYACYPRWFTGWHNEKACSYRQSTEQIFPSEKWHNSEVWNTLSGTSIWSTGKLNWWPFPTINTKYIKPWNNACHFYHLLNSKKRKNKKFIKISKWLACEKMPPQIDIVIDILSALNKVSIIKLVNTKVLSNHVEMFTCLFLMLF
jgi:hypothetical protein